MRRTASQGRRGLPRHRARHGTELRQCDDIEEGMTDASCAKRAAADFDVRLRQAVNLAAYPYQAKEPLKNLVSSFARRREPRKFKRLWMPACAGTTVIQSLPNVCP